MAKIIALKMVLLDDYGITQQRGIIRYINIDCVEEVIPKEDLTSTTPEGEKIKFTNHPHVNSCIILTSGRQILLENTVEQLINMCKS